MMYLVMGLTALVAGIVQGVAGFGSGPIQMMTYPIFNALPIAAAISVAVSVLLNMNMTYTYRKSISFKKVLIPEVLYIVVCSLGIYFSTSFNQVIMKKVFGVFLIVLASYYLFFHRQSVKPLSNIQTFAYIVISAICDALFGIGGPLMVIYFLKKTDSTKEYLGTVSAFFLFNGVYNTCFRVVRGILTPVQLPVIGICIVCILVGVTIAHKVVKYLNEDIMKKITYVMIGLTGLFNLF